jgi:hypothetical protein
MDRQEFETACRSDLDRLKEIAEALLQDAEEVRAARLPDPVAVGERLRSAGRYADDLRQRIEKAAGELGEPTPVWQDRAQLEACLAWIGETMARQAEERPRRRLRGLTNALGRGRFLNRRTHTLVTAFEEVRLQALAETERAAQAEVPPDLPGPDQGEHWLSWAWGLDTAALDADLARIRDKFPHLVQLAYEADPSHWEAAGEIRLLAAETPPAMSSPKEAQPSSVPDRDGASPPAPPPETAVPAPLAMEGTVSGNTVTEGTVSGNTVTEGTEAVMLMVPPALPAATTPDLPPVVPPSPGLAAVAEKVGPPPVSQSLEEAARAALHSDGTERCWQAGEVVWHLIDRGMPGLAAYLARAIESLVPGLRPRLPAWLCRAVALAPCLRHPNGEVARHLQEALSQYTEEECFTESAAWNRPMRLLLAAASLRPALLAPEVGAGRLLKDLRFERELQSLSALCRAAAEFSDGRQPLDLQALKQTQDRAAWEAAETALLQELRSWLDAARHRTLKYQAATVIWQKWLREGLVHELLEPLLDPEYGRLPVTEQLRRRQQIAGRAADLSDEGWLRDRVDREDARARKRKAIQIVGAPFDRIVDYSFEAATLAQRWLDLEQTRPAPPDDFRVRLATRFQDQLSRLGPLAGDELDRLAGEESAMPRGAARAGRAALESVENLLNPRVQLSAEDGCVRRALRADLLRIPDLAMDGHGEPQTGTDEQLVEVILQALAGPLPDWEQSFRARAARRDHLATELIVKYLEGAGTAGLDLEAFRRKHEEGVWECRRELEDMLHNVRKQIEEAVAFGLLSEEKRTAMMAQVRVAEQRLPDMLRFGPTLTELKEIPNTIDACRREQVEQARRRMEASGLPADHPAVPRINEVLDRGDIFSANDYLEMARRGEALPDRGDRPDCLVDFFSDRGGLAVAHARQLDDFLAKQKPREYMRRVRDGEAVCGLDLARVPQNLRSYQPRPLGTAHDMLEAWFAAAQRNRITEEEVRRIFAGLGFTPLQVSVNRSGRTWAEVQTEPVRERDLCPLPVFGSAADGRYRVLCVWGRPSEQDLIGQVGETHPGASLVFYFGRMTVQRRRDLARLRFEHRRTFLVLDDILLAYLCGERGSRLPVLFACGLPFTYADLYPIAPSLVPPEMFYGRRRERDEVLNPFGSCFIYGGRQLGKTALLRDAEQTFNRTPGHAAIWLDLKDARVGIDRDLWPFLAEALKGRGLVPASVPSNIGPDKLLGHIEEWLEEHPTRRLLLLLDEADVFLKKDSDGGEAGTAGAYGRVTKLKGLMDRSKRRFKIVFAGLHNVQRTTRLANHPLAHYGEPICIGPLLDNGEWREARALIERPLGALGYRFASPDLVTRILSHTNYYPSLIQLYCNHLLRHITGPGRVAFDPKNSPPYLITEEHVEAAYRSEGLRKAIRDRFTWTLQLDQRYELLANVIAYHALVEDGSRGVNGLTGAEARDRACALWADGFAEGPEGDRRPLPEDAVHALLDEMVGLGVLRKSGGRYGLRSPNILLLMGSERDIEDALTRQREPSLDQIDPALFRAPLSRDGPARPEMRSPLTAAQEAELKRPAHGVTLLFGTRATGLGLLREALAQSFSREFFATPGSPDTAAFGAALDRLKERKEGTTLLWVGPDSSWSADWVEQALDKTARLTSDKAHVRVAFAADPALAWSITADSDALNGLRGLGARVVSLEPWQDPAVRQWLEECQCGPADKGGRETLRLVTGNWPWLLAEFQRRCQAGGSWEDHLRRLETDLTGENFRARLLRIFGLDTEEPAEVLRYLVPSAYGPLPESDLADLVGDAGRVAAVLRWAELLRLADQVEDGWQVDPVVTCLLQPLWG